MKHSYLSTHLSRAVFDAGPDRRQFLRLTLALGFGLPFAASRRGLGAEATTKLDETDFRKAVADFLKTLVPNSGTQQKQILAAPVTQRKPKDGSVHEAHAARYQLVGVPVVVLQTEHGYWVQLGADIRSDNQPQPRTFKDVNLEEARRIQDPLEIACYGSPVHPCGYRSAVTASDLQKFEHVARKEYGLKPETLTLDYVRPFRSATQKKSYLGFGCHAKADPTQKDLLLDTEGKTSL